MTLTAIGHLFFIRDYFPPAYLPHADNLYLFRCRMLHNFSPAYFSLAHASPANHLKTSPIGDTVSCCIARSTHSGDEPPHPRGKGTRRSSFALKSQAPICAPMHSFRLGREVIVYAWRSTKLLSNRLCSTQGAAVRGFSLTLICELVTLAACKHTAPIQNRHPAVAGSHGAMKPWP